MFDFKDKKMFRSLALRPVPWCLFGLFVCISYKFGARMSVILILLSLAHMKTVIFGITFYVDCTSLITSIGLASNLKYLLCF